MLRRWPFAGISVVLLAGLVQVIAVPSASATTGTGTTTTTVTVYSGPGSSNAQLSTIAPQTTVSFTCYVRGQSVTGTYGTENSWDALAGGGYAPDALIFTGHNNPVVSACPSAQFGVGTYPVAWTGGAGAQPYSGTSTSSGIDGAILPDGQLVSVTCETSGQTLTDSSNFTSDLWDRLSSGAYIPNVYIDTQVNGPTPGLPTCPPPNGSGSSAQAPAPPAQQAPPPGSNTSNNGSAANGSTASCPKPSGSYYVANHGGLSVPIALYYHYISGTGTSVVIDWSFFSQSTSFVAFAKGIPVGQTKYYRDGITTSMLYALGSFQVVRTSTSCYAIYDHYDFAPTKNIKKLPDTIITLPDWALQLAGAKEFYEQGAGSL